tara:strand:- start:30 stop:575 length:546 start_codon:yes stop_codon:yes gene_type:complete
MAIVQWSFLERWDIRNPISDLIYTIGSWCQGDLNLMNRKFWPGNSFASDYQEKQLEKFIDIFYKLIYNDNYGLLNLLKNIYACQLYFEAKNIKYYMLLATENLLLDLFDMPFNKEVDSTKFNIIELREYIDWTKFIFLEKENRPYFSILDLGKELDDIGDYGHPLEETHTRFANELRRRIF